MRRVAVVLFVLLAACGSDVHDLPLKRTTTTTSSSSFGTTAVSTPENSVQGELVDVQVGAHTGFTRVVFRFANGVPGYSVKAAEPPFVQDGSGKDIAVEGNGHLAVRLIARAHDDDGKTTVPATVSLPKTSSVRVVALLGDFEGVVNYVIGLSEPKGFKVFTLSSPARLVVDIQSP